MDATTTGIAANTAANAATGTAKALPPLLAADRGHLPDRFNQRGWSPEEKLVAHRNMHLLYPSALLCAAERPLELKQGEALGEVHYTFDRGPQTLASYAERMQLAALLVLKDGRIVLQRYLRGTDEDTVWATRSVAKSITSTLVGMAIADGALRSVDDRIGDHVPELKGTHYENVPLWASLQMASGQPHLKEYPTGAVFQRCVAEGTECGCFLRALQTIAAPSPQAVGPGERFAYHSADQLVLGLVLARALGKPVSTYLQDKLWLPFGMERAAAWNLEAPGGGVFANSGFCASLRDWGRFGLFLAAGGCLPNGTPLLPAGWLAQATRPSAASLRAGFPYGYAWWLPDPQRPADMPDALASYQARGSSGQTLFIHPSERVVVAKWATWAEPPQPPSGQAALQEDDALFAAIVRALH